HDGAEHLCRDAEDGHECRGRRGLGGAAEIWLHEGAVVRIEPADAAGGTLIDGRLAAQRSHRRRDGFRGDIVAVEAALGKVDAECAACGVRCLAEGDEDRVEARGELGGGSHGAALLWRRPRRTSDSASVTAHATGSTTVSVMLVRSA